MKAFGKLKEEAVDLILWRTRFQRDCGRVIRHYVMLMIIAVGYYTE
jgi:hypothetical protein